MTTAQPDVPARPGRAATLASRSLGAGRRIILVHGFTQSQASWRHIAERLAASFEVVTVDLPGHGDSSEIEPTDFVDAARLVGAVGGRASYVGYSLGGRLVLTLALEQPELVDHLICVGASAGIEAPDERAARRHADGVLADRLQHEDGDAAAFERFLDNWLAGPLFAHLTDEQSDRPARRRNRGRGLASSLRTAGAAEQAPSWSRLETLTMPVSIVTGERDTKFNALAEQMVAAIGPNATRLVVADVGHAVPFEAPDRFADLVADELTTRSRP